MITLPVSKQFIAMMIGLTSKGTHARITLASSPQISHGLLLLLSNDSQASVRWGVAMNETTPQSVLEKLAHDADLVVSQSAIKNPNLGLDYIKALSTGCGNIAEIAECEIAHRKLLKSKTHQISQLVKKFKLHTKWALREKLHLLQRTLGLCPVCNGHDASNNYMGDFE